MPRDLDARSPGQSLHQCLTAQQTCIVGCQCMNMRRKAEQIDPACTSPAIPVLRHFSTSAWLLFVNLIYCKAVREGKQHDLALKCTSPGSENVCLETSQQLAARRPGVNSLSQQPVHLLCKPGVLVRKVADSRLQACVFWQVAAGLGVQDAVRLLQAGHHIGTGTAGGMPRCVPLCCVRGGG